MARILPRILPRTLPRILPPLAIAALATCAVFGCASILGLDEVTEVDPNDEGGTDANTTNDAEVVDGAVVDVNIRDGGADARDARPDAMTDGGVDASDAGCRQVIQTNFTAVALPPQAVESKDALGSTIVYDMTGAGATRGMHVTVPLGATNAGLTVNIASLRNDGAKVCAVTCGVDVTLVQRGAPAGQSYEMIMVQGLGTLAASANISHSNNASYFSIGLGPDAPDLGTLSPAAAFTRISIDVTGAAAPFTTTGAVGAASNAKALTVFPDTVRIGLEKIATDVAVEAVFDNLDCRSRLP